MTILAFLKFILAILMIITGAFLLIRGFRKNNKKVTVTTDDLNDKDGIPVVPRHLRKFSEHGPKVDETPRLNVGRTGKVIPINEGNTHSLNAESANADYTDSNTNGLQSENSQITTPESHSMEISDSLHHNYDIPPVTIQSNIASSSIAPVDESRHSGVNTSVELDLDTDVNIDTDINFDNSLIQDIDGYRSIENTGHHTTASTSTEETQNSNNQLDEHFDDYGEQKSHIIHYTSAYSSDSKEDEYGSIAEQIISLEDEEDAFSSLATATKILEPHYQVDKNNEIETTNNKIDNDTHAVYDNELMEETTQVTNVHEVELSSVMVDKAKIDNATVPNSNVYDSVSNIIHNNAYRAEQSMQTSSESRKIITSASVPESEVNNLEDGIVHSQFANESKVLNEHLEKTEVEDQNSPLINASDNINISILPVNEFNYISGEKLLQLVDDFGFKFGSMNMFHRYQNKDGTGILWFSMMGLTDEGIVPFDLNTLPTASNLKGLVMFLPLPHPKVLQGFDSMMSIAGLLAREVNGYIVDEDGDEMTAEYKKKLRTTIQSTLVD